MTILFICALQIDSVGRYAWPYDHCAPQEQGLQARMPVPILFIGVYFPGELANSSKNLMGITTARQGKTACAGTSMPARSGGSVRGAMDSSLRRLAFDLIGLCGRE
jgi:hypothetical protein